MALSSCCFSFCQTLPSPQALLFRVAHAFQLRRGPFVSDMSPKFIDREGLGGRRTGSRQDQTLDRLEVKLLQKKLPVLRLESFFNLI